MTEKQAKIIGWLGTTLAILMYVSYIPQIMGNLNGNKTSFIQPLVAAINPKIIPGKLAKTNGKSLSFLNKP